MTDLEKARQEYFSDCKLVVRSPGCFFLTGDHSVEYGQPGLLIAVNHWAYVGIRKASSEEEDLLVRYVDPSAPLESPLDISLSKHYLSSDDPSKFLKESIRLLRSGLKAWALSVKNEVPQFKIWSDIPFAVGLNAGAAISSCLGILLYSLEKDISESALRDLTLKYQSQSHAELMINQDFVRIFHLARWCDALLASHMRSGAQVLTSLVQTRRDADLVLYFTDVENAPSSREIMNPETEFARRMEEIASSRIASKRFRAPGWFREVNRISIVYSGQVSDPDEVLEDMSSWHRQDTTRIRNLVRKDFGKDFRSFREIAEPLAQIAAGRGKLKKQENWPQLMYTEVLGMISWRIIDLLLQQENRTTLFTKLLVDYNEMLKAYGALRGDLRRFERTIRTQLFPDDLGDKIWTKLIGSGNGGDLFVFGTAHTIQEINKHLRSSFDGSNSKMAVLHCSTADNAILCPDSSRTVCKFHARSQEKPERLDLEKKPHPKITLFRADDGRVEIRVRIQNRMLSWKSPSPLYSQFLELLVGNREEKRPAVSVMDICVFQNQFHKSRAVGTKPRLKQYPSNNERILYKRAAAFIDNFFSLVKKSEIPGLDRRALLESCETRKGFGEGNWKAWRLNESVHVMGFYQDALDNLSLHELNDSNIVDNPDRSSDRS